MREMRGEERWAAACIEAALPSVVANPHDDGTRSGMHDYDLFREGIRFGACEITAAADAETIALWKLVNGNGRRIEPELQGGWWLSLSPSCKAKRLWAGLKGLLRAMESQGVVEADQHSGAPDFQDELARLGIVHALHTNTGFPGSVYFTIDLPQERSGGMVPRTGDALAEWLSTWINSPEQEHNVAKLRRAGTSERHLFVLFPGFSPAPFEVTDVLMRPDGPLPTIDPELPDGITHVWAMSIWDGGDLFAWTASGRWRRYPKV